MLEPQKPGDENSQTGNLKPQSDEKPGMGGGTAPDQEGLDPKEKPAKE